MATYNTLPDLFGAIANSIRGKTGGSAEIVADDFPSAIDGIPPVIVREVDAESSTMIRLVAQEGEDFSVYNRAAVMIKPYSRPEAAIADYAESELIINMVVFSVTTPVAGWMRDCTIIYHATDIEVNSVIDTVNTPFQQNFTVLAPNGSIFAEGQRYTIALWRE